MIETREIVLRRVVARVGTERLDNAALVSSAACAATGFASRRVVAPGTALFDFAHPVVAAALDGVDPASVTGVIAATFSHERRFPSLAVRFASAAGLSAATAAFDLQLACSAYPYAVYLAGRLAADTGGDVLVIDGDIQSRFTRDAAPGTAAVMDDAVTATLVRAGHDAARSRFAFHSAYGEALACPAEGPIEMDGFRVFAFVATQVTSLLREVVRETGEPIDLFVPHHANGYMVRQLAKSVGLDRQLLIPGGDGANPGSASVPLALARGGRGGARALLAGFGAGLSAAVGTVRLAEDFAGREI